MKFNLDTFHRTWIFILIALIAGCTGCAMFSGGELSDKDLIEEVSDAGCNLKTIKRDDGVIERIDCHETIRYTR